MPSVLPDVTKSRALAATTLVFLAFSAAALGGACSASPGNTFNTAGTGGGSSSTTSPSGTGGALFSTATGSGGGNIGVGGSGDSCPSCSADLKSVVDCNQKATACPTGQACSAGVCVDNPCDAATQSKSSVGCEYWAVNLDHILFGSCFAAYVTNTWTTPVHIKVDLDGQALPIAQFARIPSGQGSQIKYDAYDETAGLAPGNVAILFLAQQPNIFGPPIAEPCPAGITPALAADGAVHGTTVGKAFHITTDAPVVGYQIFPYGGGDAAITHATLLLPTSAWDTNYIAVNAYKKSQVSGNEGGVPTLDVVANEDGTQVTISPVAPIVAGTGVPGTATGQPVTYSLNKGQYLQITQDDELTGSAVQSNKPVAFFGGNACMNIPADAVACDSGGQQIPPVRALGHEYAAVRYRGRNGNADESVPWRFVGAVDGTQLTYVPAAPPGAPSSLSSGQLVEINAPGPFVVKSQDANHPFYAAAFMTGGDAFNGEGDPEFVNIVPTAQYLDSYVFFTDPTYPETNLVLVRAKNAGGAFGDVELDCAGSITGWQTLGDYQYARVDLVTGAFQSVNGCSNGRHYIHGTAPFGVTVWGWGSSASLPFSSTYASYAYPAGAGVKPVSGVVVPAVPK